jgi:segregation and condensation protein B
MHENEGDAVSNDDPLQQPALSPDVMPPAAGAVQYIEAILFVAAEPVAVGQLAKTLELSADAVEDALEQLREQCAQRGVRLQRTGEHVQLVTAPEAATMVGRFLGVERTARLSNAALEVLAIIAYRQPLTRAQIEAVRGVDSSGVVRALLARDLVAEVGRLEAVGRPILYGTTGEFLRQFGLTSLSDLPSIEGFDRSVSAESYHMTIAENEITNR